MAKIKHIALSTQDPEKTAAFYMEAFGLKEIRKIDSELARGCMLTDGYINIAILNFKTDKAADIEGGTKYSGLHHIGFKVDSQEEAAEVLRKVGASQRTERMKLLIYGNCLPIHEPLRLAEELAMLDCLTDGRLISGFVRGIPREYIAYGVDQGESRARFQEAWEIIKLAWSEAAFSYQGDF